jgi:hypothetical protein
MNTKSLLTRIGVPVLSLGLLGGLGATLATSASAAVKPPTATVVASTNEINVPDTTSGTTTSKPTDFGAVWAYDNVTKTFRVTPNGGNQYTVTETVNGTFAAFDEPNTRTAADIAANTPGPEIMLSPNVTGQMHGTNTYTVTSPNAAPDAAGLAAQYDDNYGTPGITTSDLIKHIFGDAADVQVGGGNNWVFAYHAAGGSMTQAYNTPTTAWGNITG